MFATYSLYLSSVKSKIQPCCQDLPDSHGAPGRIRTCDPRLRRPLLYPAELRALGESSLQKWSVRQDLNLRPLVPKTSALPSCATHRLECFVKLLIKLENMVRKERLELSRREALEPKSSVSTNSTTSAKKWGGRWDLNPRQPESQSGALPTELRPP